MSSERVNVAMLGAGFIGQAHSVAFRDASLGRLDSRAVANFVALADRNLALAADLAQRFGWQTCVSSWEELPETDVDLFVNAAPNDAHLVPSVGLAERGAFVFCEKPAGRDAEEAFALWEGVHRAGVGHRSAFIFRSVPALRYARHLIQTGQLGTVTAVRTQGLLNMRGPNGELSWRFSRERAGAGCLGDMGSHYIDAVRFLTGAEITRVTGITRTVSTDPAGEITDVNDDLFSCIAELDDNIVATIEASRVAGGRGFGSRIEVDGTTGSIVFDLQRLNELTIHENGGSARTEMITRGDDPFAGFWAPAGIQQSPPVSWFNCYAFQAYDVLGLASGQFSDAPLGTLEDGYRVAAIVDAIELSAREGGKPQDVTFRRLDPASLSGSRDRDR